ncbi:hypothetical protein KKB99_04075, partial [bacterium]|nr:hypothetical protein [bacterium]MBU1025171.1 hypothetical protein [bacterium]
ITCSSLIQTESLFIFLMSVSCYLSFAATRRGYNTFWFMLGGITVAYAYLTRGIGITFLVIFPLAVWLVSKYDGAFRILTIQRKYFIGLTLFLVGFVIIALPYQVMLSRVYDKFLLSDQSKWHSPRVLHPERDFSPDPRYDGSLNADKSDYLINDPEFFKSDGFSGIAWTKAFLAKYLKNQVGIYYYHLRELFSPLIMILAGLGLFGGVWDRRFKTLMLLFGIWSVPFLVLQPMYYTEARYISPLIVFALVFAGRGFVVLIEWLVNTLPKYNPLHVERISAVVLFLFLTPMMIYPLTHRGPKYSYPELREAGNFLGSYFSKSDDKGVMAVLPITGYYAHAAPNLVLPKGDIDSVVPFAMSKNIKYIVLEERKVHILRPELRELLYQSAELGSVIDGLKLIFDNDDISGYKVRIFEIVD